MTRDLEASIEQGRKLGKMAMYWGCWKTPGHYLHDADGRTWKTPSDLPWDLALMDGGLLNNMKEPDMPTGRVHWVCGGNKVFWYAFVWWDRSVDKRGECNSGFYVRGFGWPEQQQAFDYACSVFPFVVARQAQPLVIQL